MNIFLKSQLCTVFYLLLFYQRNWLLQFLTVMWKCRIDLDKAEWLVELCRRKPSSWTGIQLVASVNLENRVLIQKQTASLIDFRNYLFSRQCLLLFMLHRAWEVAERTIPTIHNCVLEIAGLQVSVFVL